MLIANKKKENLLLFKKDIIETKKICKTENAAKPIGENITCSIFFLPHC
ncbi:hypothetical protein CKO_00747 [Citrobacter koseri ATCC BAA-895]|uniref:Uncharacterized protein n=1 Tax=Citrobacter koseri (strain ATCC BAA-895 / CDC 4225-83 / SGSC4696) TaxID=290338 RepID=A8AEI6_CITK8|nr:hypothetical protein CKO_00747 [Citrobacter koseri ATCC BAA-895]